MSENKRFAVQMSRAKRKLVNLNCGTAMAWSSASLQEKRGDHDKGFSKRILAVGADISNRISDGGSIGKRVIIQKRVKITGSFESPRHD